MRSEIARDLGMTNVMGSPLLFFGLHSRTAGHPSHRFCLDRMGHLWAALVENRLLLIPSRSKMGYPHNALSALLLDSITDAVQMLCDHRARMYYLIDTHAP